MVIMRKLIVFILCLWQGCMAVMAQVTNSSTPPGGTVQTQNSARIDGNYPLLYFGQYGGQYRYAYPLTTATNRFPFTITKSTFTVGKVINSFDDIVEDLSQSQPPTANLTGGMAMQRTTVGQSAVTLNYSYGKQTGTQDIATTSPSWVRINNSESGITQNANGATGSLQRVINNNTNTTYTLLVTTIDGKTAQSSTNFTWYDRRYVGFATSALQGDGTPTDANITAATFKDNSGANININTTLPQQGIDRFLFIATTAPVNHITINGFPSDAAYNMNISRVVVNESGGSQTYYISVSKAASGSTGQSQVVTN